jgi:Na+-driven multidrug efflux pump
MAGATAVSLLGFVINNVMTAAGFAMRSLVLTAIRIYALSVPACAIGAYVIGKTVSAVMICLLISAGLALVVNFIAEKDFFSRLTSGKLQIRLPAQQPEANGP